MDIRRFPAACVLAAAVAVVLSASGCLAESKAPVDIPLMPGASSAASGTGNSGSAGSQGASDSNATKKSGAVPAKALNYAKNLGGWDHKGQDLYFIVGATFHSEVDAQAALDKALPRFGDMQSYFIVQRSDSFAGMAPGSWVVVEAHFKSPSDDNMLFARRGFPDAHVVRAQVTVTAPIPVFEDMVGGD